LHHHGRYFTQIFKHGEQERRRQDRQPERESASGWWSLTLPVLIEIVFPLAHSDIERSNRNIGHVRKTGARFLSFFGCSPVTRLFARSAFSRQIPDDRVMCKSIDGSHGCLGILFASIRDLSNLQGHCSEQMDARGDNGLIRFGKIPFTIRGKERL
jgi:hypothetical protein